MRTGRPAAVLKRHIAPVYSATFSPNGALVVTTSLDKTARVWNTHTGRLVATLRGHKALVYGAAASWQAGEAPVDKFQANFDWAFYRNADSAFIQASNQLSQTHKLLRDIKMGGAYDSLALWISLVTTTTSPR